MKTIKQLAGEHGIHRSTLSLAAKQGRFPVTQYGKVYVIDEQSGQFQQWLGGFTIGRPRHVKKPQPPG